MAATIPQDQFFWALTPRGWVTCESLESRPADAVAVARIVSPRRRNVEDGVGVSTTELAHVGENKDLLAQYGQAPQYPIPQESLDRIVQQVTELVGLRKSRSTLWDSFRNALIEARYLRGVVYGSEQTPTKPQP